MNKEKTPRLPNPKIPDISIQKASRLDEKKTHHLGTEFHILTPSVNRKMKYKTPSMTLTDPQNAVHQGCPKSNQAPVNMLVS